MSREHYKAVTTDANITNITFVQQDRLDATIKHAALISADAQKAERHAVAECVLCYTGYSNGRLGGARCTTVLCGLCDKELHFGSTCVDRLCLECAKAHGLCKHCGADVDLKQRRKLWLKKNSPAEQV